MGSDMNIQNEDLEQRYKRGVQLAEDKYPQYLEGVRSIHQEAKDEQLPPNLASTLGICLENTEREVRKQVRKKGAVATEQLTSSDLGSFIKHGFELISAIIPTSITNELVSVQPMERKTGLVHWLDYVYSDDKGQISAGDQVFGANDGPNFAERGSYSSERTFGETLAEGDGSATQFTEDLEDFPVRPGTVSITDGTQELSDDGDGNLIGDGSGTIDYSNASVDVTFDTAPDSGDEIRVDYQYNLDENPSAIKGVKMDIREQTIKAEKRALKTNWLLDSVSELEQHYGIDIDEELVSLLAGTVRAEIDQHVIDRVFANAPRSNQGTFDASTPEFVTQNERNEDFLNRLLDDSAQIESQTRKATGNWIIAGEDVISLMEGIPEWFDREDFGGTPPSGPHFRGTFHGRWRVYKSYEVPSDEYVIGYKGDNFLRAGIVYAPFIPVMVTDPYPVGDLEWERGVLTKAATAVVNNGMYVRNRVDFGS